MGVSVDTTYGGTGSSFFSSILVVEEIAKVDPSVSVLVDIQNTVVNNMIDKYGSIEQKKKYLTKLTKDTVNFTSALFYS